MKFLQTLFIFLFSLQLHAQDSGIPSATKGTQYGSGVSEDITFNIYSPDKIIRELTTKDSLQNIVIQADVTAVCTKKGCWMTLQNTQNQTVFVKMKDYAFFVPQDMVGKKVLIHGDVTKKVTSVAELRHYAEDAKRPKHEIDTITEPKTEYRVLASGIKVVSS